MTKPVPGAVRGRPKKPPADRRTEQLTVWVRPAVKAALDDLALAFDRKPTGLAADIIEAGVMQEPERALVRELEKP